MNNNAFITAAIPFPHAFHYYQKLHQAYTQQMVRKGRAMKLLEKLKVVDAAIDGVRSKLKEASEIES